MVNDPSARNEMPSGSESNSHTSNEPKPHRPMAKQPSVVVSVRSLGLALRTLSSFLLMTVHAAAVRVRMAAATMMSSRVFSASRFGVAMTDVARRYAGAKKLSSLVSSYAGRARTE